MRYRVDAETRIDGHQIVGGSPPSVLKVSEAGRHTLDRIIAGDDVEPGQLLDRLVDLGIVHPAVDPAPLVDSSGRPRISVVTPTLGEPAHRQRHGLDPQQVIIVDDGSAPPVEGATIRSEHNLGPASARNRGIEMVTTEFCAFVDADVDTRRDGGDSGRWLESLLAHFDDPRVAAVAPRIRSRPGPGLRARYDHRHGALDLGDREGPVRPGTRLAYVPSAVLVCRTDAVRDIGGFDETLRTGEDVDLIWRLVAAGHRVRYDPSVEVLHEPRATWRAWIEQRIGYGESTAPLEKRHPGRLAPLVTSPWSAAAIAAVIVPRRWWRGLPLSTTIMAVASLRLRRRVHELDLAASARVVSVGTMRTAEALTKATRRAWWPVVIALCWLRPIRRLAVISAIAARSPIAVVDDVAHGLGVWRGMLRERSLAAIIPRLVTGRPERATTSTYHSRS
ncbi:MAG: mycofactocin biosynthesis glycosyltransferase MftF [Ilumatobacteraceae bacterium]